MKDLEIDLFREKVAKLEKENEKLKEQLKNSQNQIESQQELNSTKLKQTKKIFQ